MKMEWRGLWLLWRMVVMDGILNFQHFSPFRDGEEQNAENPLLSSRGKPTPNSRIKAGQAPPKRGMVLYKDCGWSSSLYFLGSSFSILTTQFSIPTFNIITYNFTTVTVHWNKQKPKVKRKEKRVKRNGFM